MFSPKKGCETPTEPSSNYGFLIPNVITFFTLRLAASAYMSELIVITNVNCSNCLIVVCLTKT